MLLRTAHRLRGARDGHAVIDRGNGDVRTMPARERLPIFRCSAARPGTRAVLGCAWAGSGSGAGLRRSRPRECDARFGGRGFLAVSSGARWALRGCTRGLRGRVVAVALLGVGPYSAYAGRHLRQHLTAGRRSERAVDLRIGHVSAGTWSLTDSIELAPGGWALGPTARPNPPCWHPFPVADAVDGAGGSILCGHQAGDPSERTEIRRQLGRLSAR